MKQSQWTVAALVLAAMVFIVTFAMNYLGEGGRGVPTTAIRRLPQHEVLFLWRTSPAAGQFIEYEAHVPGHQDFWFRNDNRDAVKVGLFKKGCKCTSVDLFYLPEDGSRRLIADAVALLGTALNGPLASPGALTPSPDNAPIKPTVTLSTLTLHALSLPELQKGANGPHQLMGVADSVDVPGGAVGWVRMHWKGERIGPQALNADLWMNDPAGNRTTLETHIRIQDPLRVQPMLALGTLRDEDLAAGVTRDILCWSSTRTSLRLEAQTSKPRDNPSSDTFLVGKPAPMTQAELRNLEKQNAGGGPENTGPVLCGYRIPVTIKGVAADGKTPFDLGPFLRRVTVSSPDVLAGEPKQVTVTGRVRGDIDIGNDENGEINFSSFPGRTGKRVPISLQSDVPGLTLTFDRKRTPEFLSAVLSKPELIKGGVRQWSLRAEVVPGKMWGVFPRRDDPLYEDSAIYLKAVVPGKPPRAVRIAVQGTANQS